MTERLNPEQLAAVEARGTVFVSAGAGTGKTSVLVERFVRAVCDDGLDVDSVLVITYTKRAAAELRERIRAALLERGRPELARELDAAWVSTIHGFCNRLLKQHPFAAGLDPRFRELDEDAAAVLRSEAFERALDYFCTGDDPDRLRLLATYGAPSLRRMMTSIYATLRSAGRELVLELGESPALKERVAELRAAAAALLADPTATEVQRAAAERMADLLADEPPRAERLLDLSALRLRRSERTDAYEDGRAAVEQAALDTVAARDRDLLQELLTRFAGAYAAAKERESALDFEDLQLAARALLRDHPSIRERESLRFRSIMVDEFQDTNRLQCDLVDLLVHGAGEMMTRDVFFVGDEFQSIYGFRHADVSVFRERRAGSPRVLALTRNYRSRPEVLAAVNEVFGAHFGDEFQPLAASGEFPDPVFGHPVELLVTDKVSYADSDDHWRRGEARHVARRVRALVDSGAAAAGEIVVLFAAGTDAEIYEQELREAGLATLRATGRGYFGQQQVADLLAYLRLLQNRYDDVALLTVLASPFVGVSNDALVLLRRAAPRRPLFSAIERSLPPALAPRDERLLRAFRQRYERLAAGMARLSLERLLDQVVAEHDYDLAVLAQRDGRRRYANMRKLARLARSYEELRGRDVEGFAEFVRELEAVGADAREAVAEEEGADAVRLLTIHSAKGLEFRVVVVADASRERPAPPSDEILALSDGRFGFRVADPVTSARRDAFAYAEVREARLAEERAERLRLYYVAMTRAKERLLISGGVDLERPDEATPLGWVLARLEAQGELTGAAAAPVELQRGQAHVLLRLDRGGASADEAAAGEREADVPQLLLFPPDLPERVVAPAPVLPLLAPLPAPPLHRVRRLSYSTLALFDRCSYRYYAERVAGLRPAQAHGSVPGQSGLAATEIGDAVHRLLELVDLRAPRLPEPEALADAVRGWYPAATDEEIGRIGAFVDGYCNSPLAARIATLEGARVEPAFAFEHDGVLVKGRLDVLHRAGGRALVVDYKTNSLAEGSPEEIVERDYRLQRLVYALACLRDGAEEVEVVYHFLERADAVVSRAFGRDEAPALGAELSRAIERIGSGDFTPRPSEFVCAGCPALDVVCAGPRLRSARGELQAVG